MFTFYNHSKKDSNTFEVTASSVGELISLLFLARPYLSDCSFGRVRFWASRPNGTSTYISKKYDFLIVRDL